MVGLTVTAHGVDTRASGVGHHRDDGGGRRCRGDTGGDAFGCTIVLARPAGGVEVGQRRERMRASRSSSCGGRETAGRLHRSSLGHSDAGASAGRHIRQRVGNRRASACSERYQERRKAALTPPWCERWARRGRNGGRSVKSNTVLPSSGAEGRVSFFARERITADTLGAKKEGRRRARRRTTKDGTVDATAVDWSGWEAGAGGSAARGFDYRSIVGRARA